MKKLSLIAMLFICCYFSTLAQGGWLKITDPANPVTTLSTPGFYKGAAWIDVNNDGWIDLFASPNRLFMNNGQGGFTSVTSGILPAPLQNPGGSSWADLNNDGWIDMINAQNPVGVWINNGDMTFSDITSGIPGLAGNSAWGCVIADMNNDNRLDLLFAYANGFHTTPPVPCLYYLQDANAFTFSKISGYEFTDQLAPYTVPYFYDYDIDGDMDIFIASGPGGSPGPDFCYKNLKIETGADSLQRMTEEPWAAVNQDGQCYSWVDYDNDGDFDLCLTNYGGAASRFFRKDGDVYTPVTMPFTNTSTRLSNSWGDYDNDGDLDVIITNDQAATQLYFNNNQGALEQATNSLTTAAGGCGAVSGDYDNDGDLDVFIHGLNAARSLFLNESVAAGHHWVNIHLTGTISNKSAIGAIVRLKTYIDGSPVWQLRQVTAQNSFQGQSDLRVHFGLKNATTIDSLQIRWSSGITETYADLEIDSFYSLIEGDGPTGSTTPGHSSFQVSATPNPVAGMVTIGISGRESYENTILQIYNVKGALLRTMPISSDKTAIDLTDYAPGVYLFLVKTGGESRSIKVIR